MGRVEEDVTIAMAVVGASDVERVVACGRRQKQERNKGLKGRRKVERRVRRKFW
ncbi:hypothetical protein PVL29_015690 [Vitis rotundifolia]|uniref:Uncharacterized protein n=1 Tax=Vitis rotundifolia TaxID=103349 RepID=A0AA38ZDL9_VITRO|nr:hypothetical protein PVL29_015690 [Vitis rotundifolia]